MTVCFDGKFCVNKTFHVFQGLVVLKKESIENYLWSTEKVCLIFRGCFPQIFFFFWKTILSHIKLSKESLEIISQLI